MCIIENHEKSVLKPSNLLWVGGEAGKVFFLLA
jgi:hypothetical protein